MFNVPQTSPEVGFEKPLPLDQSNGSPVILSPIYERLVTNIPKTLMQYPHRSFPSKVQLFPTHRQTQKYLEEYAQEFLPLIKFGTQVIGVEFLGSKSEAGVEKDQWKVRTKQIKTQEESVDTYDAIIAANGHYSACHVPDITGVKEWRRKYPDCLSHSKYYRRPEDFTGKRVIVVGNSASGLDIASQIAGYAKSPVLISSRSESFFAGGFAESSDIQNIPEITSFNAEDGSIDLKDGKTLTSIDRVIFCTGYLYTLPFLKGLQPSPLVPDGTRLAQTYHHLFYAPHPSLTFMVLPQKVIPFQVAEAQSAVLARVYSGRLPVPSLEEMDAWERNRIEATDDGGGFHTFKFPEDAEYINMLYDWALEADRRSELENEGVGMLAGRWGPKEYWLRERFAAIRKAYVEKGDKSETYTTLESVGFDYEQFRHEEKENAEAK